MKDVSERCCAHGQVLSRRFSAFLDPERQLQARQAAHPFPVICICFDEAALVDASWWERSRASPTADTGLSTHPWQKRTRRNCLA